MPEKLLVLWFILAFSDAVAASLLGVGFIRRSAGLLWALAMGAVALESAAAFCWFIFAPLPLVEPLAASEAFERLAPRVLKALVFWLLVYCMFFKGKEINA